MPERIKVRAKVAALLLGRSQDWEPGRGPELAGDTRSAQLRALEVADICYQLFADQDLQRTLAVARATHEHSCVAPEEMRGLWKGDQCCGHCLRAALLDCTEFNRTRSVQEAEKSPPLFAGRPEDEHWLARERHAAEAAEGARPMPEDPLGAAWGGAAEELTLYRLAQRSGAALLIAGPEHPGASVRIRMRNMPARAEMMEGLKKGIATARQLLEEILREHQEPKTQSEEGEAKS